MADWWIRRISLIGCSTAEEGTMRSIWRIFEGLVLASGLACVAPAQPVVSAVLNAASYEALVSPGCLVTIFGSNLAPAPATASAVPLPSTLGGVSISVAGLA